MTDHDGGAPSLPDFSGGARNGPGGHGGAPAGAGGIGEHGGPGSPGGPGDAGGPGGPPSSGGGGRGPLLAFLLGGTGLLVVVLAVVALVLSQTVFATGEEPTAGPEEASTEAEDPERTRPSEYVPGEEESTSAGEDVTLAQQPTVPCTILDNVVETEQVAGTVRGGGLELTPPEGWDVGGDWSGGDAYRSDQSFLSQPVENGWFAVTSVGAVRFPEEEGGYPGAEEAARALFQCGMSTEDSREIYGDPVEMEDYRDEAITVDGHPARIVSADVRLSELALFHTTDAWRVVVIVVDTPEGPAAFDGGAALGHDQQVTDLETMIESLRVH